MATNFWDAQTNGVTFIPGLFKYSIYDHFKTFAGDSSPLYLSLSSSFIEIRSFSPSIMVSEREIDGSIRGLFSLGLLAIHDSDENNTCWLTVSASQDDVILPEAVLLKSNHSHWRWLIIIVVSNKSMEEMSPDNICKMELVFPIDVMLAQYRCQTTSFIFSFSPQINY